MKIGSSWFPTHAAMKLRHEWGTLVLCLQSPEQMGQSFGLPEPQPASIQEMTLGVGSRPCDGGDDGDGDDTSRRTPGRRTPEPEAQQQESSSWGEFSTMEIVEIPARLAGESSEETVHPTMRRFAERRKLHATMSISVRFPCSRVTDVTFLRNLESPNGCWSAVWARPCPRAATTPISILNR